MAIIDYYFYFIYNAYRKVFGLKWMDNKANVLYGFVIYILTAHLALFILCIHELGAPMGIWVLITFFGIGIALGIYTSKRFLNKKYMNIFIPIAAQPNRKRKIKLLLTALLLPLHILLYLNIPQ